MIKQNQAVAVSSAAAAAAYPSHLSSFLSKPSPSTYSPPSDSSACSANEEKAKKILVKIHICLVHIFRDGLTDKESK